MKALLTVAFAALAMFSHAQSVPYGMHLDGSNYFFVSVDPTTGNINTLSTAVPGMQAFVSAEKTAIDTANNWYICMGHDGNTQRLMAFDLTTGALVHNNQFVDNVVGLEFNCADQNLYGLLEDQNLYYLVRVNVATASVTQIANIPTVSAYVNGSFSLDWKRGLYNFQGLNGINFLLYSIDITNGTIVHNNGFSDNVIGMEYNCQDSTIYGLWEDGNDYKLEAVDPATGTHSTVGILPNVTPGWISETPTMNDMGHYTYHGFEGANMKFFTIDVSNATLINNVPFTENVAGFEATNCCTPIITGPAPDADFIGNPLLLAQGGSVTYFDLSTESPTSWEWSFPGGNPSSSTMQHPSGIVYDSAGCYDVTLIATNAFGSDTMTKVCYIDVFDPSGIEEGEYGTLKVLVGTTSTGHVMLQVKQKNTGPLTCSIFNLSGELIQTKKQADPTFWIQRGTFAQGAYFFVIEAEDGRFRTGKFRLF